MMKGSTTLRASISRPEGVYPDKRCSGEDGAIMGLQYLSQFILTAFLFLLTAEG
jgi:hypothetical protein